jgi:large subunit ribosomal protein L4
MRRAALRSALTQWLQEGSIIVVEELAFEAFKTKQMTEVLSAVGIAGQKVLIVIAESDPKIEISTRNIPGVGLLRAEGLNVYDVLRHDKLLITRAAMEAVVTRLADKSQGAS